MLRVHRLRSFVAVFIALLFSADAMHSRGEEAESPSLQLTLPPRAYAVVGHEFRIYPENLILTPSPEKFRFRFSLEQGGEMRSLGAAEPRYFSFRPAVGHLGRYALRMEVRDASDNLLQRAETELIVSAADAGSGKPLTLLIIGDSLTHATVYPNELARMLSEPGNPKWSMLGTHRPASAKPGVVHEGYGGWTWQNFSSRVSSVKPGDPIQSRGSPFVFVDESNKPTLDVARYFEEHCEGRRPDVIPILLGINDCFSANPDDPKKLDERIDTVLERADTLLTAMRKAAPEATFAICLTPAPNVREAAFEANYKGNYSRWGWRRIQHRLVQRQIQHFGGREKEKISLVPTELGIDPRDGYPDNNGVHPNEMGYRQISETLYAWIKAHLSAAQ